MSFPCSSSAGAAPTITARRVGKSFRNGPQRSVILQELSLAIAPAQLTLIEGPSGCGKSTLLAVLSGLQACDTGEVTALGQRLDGLSRHALEQFRLRHTGFVFQGFNLFPALTAWEQVVLPLQYLDWPAAEIHRRADQVLEEVGLGHRRHLRPAALSGGEKQRVAIARAMAKAPALLFADEPTSALDAANGQIVIDLLHRMARDHGTTVLCVSHDPRLNAHADRLLTMEDGRILNDRADQPAESAMAEGRS